MQREKYDISLSVVRRGKYDSYDAGASCDLHTCPLISIYLTADLLISVTCVLALRLPQGQWWSLPVESALVCVLTMVVSANTHTWEERGCVFVSVHNGRESQDEYLSACACGCVCFNSSVRLRTPQWRHPHPPDTCLTGYNVTIIWTWHQNNLPMSPWREPGTLLTQPPELTPRLTCKQYTYVLFPPPSPMPLISLSAKQGDRCATRQKLHLCAAIQTRSTWL